MSWPPDGPLEHWFVRYWDGTLTPTQMEEFNRCLIEDPVAQEQFQLFCLQTLAFAETRPLEPVMPRSRSRKWQRRGILAVCVVAFALLVAVFTWWSGPVEQPKPPSQLAYLSKTTGNVWLKRIDQERLAEAGAAIDPGTTVATRGFDSSAVLNYSDGTAVILTGDTVATVSRTVPSRLTIEKGTISADIQPTKPGEALSIATAEAVAVPKQGTTVTVGKSPGKTEVGVIDGQVHVMNPTGEPLMDMTTGEIGTIITNGVTQKQIFSSAPESYRWHPEQPLPKGWETGCRELLDMSWVVRSVFWDDPLIGRTCQIRSDKDWTRGLFQLHPDSEIRFRYRVDRPGRGQFLIVVRPDPPRRMYTDKPKQYASAVLEIPHPFVAARPGEWETVTVQGQDLQLEKVQGDYSPPWVGFLVIFNTYETDLGLRVSDFRVTRPEEPKR